MRIGINPEKIKKEKIIYKQHRVIIPVYIPDSEDLYFKNLEEVFYLSINSLLKTIDKSQTNITIINSNSKSEIGAYIQSLLDKNKIDKYVHYTINYGKVYSVLQESKAAFEPFITIADADVFFFSNWQNKVLKVFGSFANVGVVGLTPDPHMAFYCNASFWSSSLFSVRKGKVVKDFDLELFERGINKKDFFITNKYNWKESQYYIRNKDCTAIVGASHFASTYQKQVFDSLPFAPPIYVFPGGELNYLDIPIDKLGYSRLSVDTAMVYHLGNTVNSDFILDDLYNVSLIATSPIKKNASLPEWPYILKDYFLRIIRKLKIY